VIVSFVRGGSLTSANRSAGRFGRMLANREDRRAYNRRVSRWLFALAAALVAGFTAEPPQRESPGGRHRLDVPYDGRFTMVRLRWRSDAEWARGAFRSAWNHDYPRAEEHLSQIVKELTYIDVRMDGSRILTLDDPELFKYPIAFMWEPGFWAMSDRDAESLRAYLLKGGFAIFEDFDGADQWGNFETQMRRVLPEGRWVKLDDTERIFDSFFKIKDIHAIVHPMSRIRPSYYGLYEDNDPSRRLMVVANYDNDVPEYWEWSGEGLFPFDASNEAYKLGVNYLIYGMTH
jgi:hypothetical protein